MPPKSNTPYSNGRREEPSANRRRTSGEFTEENIDWDQPMVIPDPPYVHNWRKYPCFVDSLIYRADVPLPPSAETGSSSQSSSILLPPLYHPIEQVLAALMAAFDAAGKFTARKFDEIYDRFQATITTREELQELKRDCKESYKCHENLARGVQKLHTKVDDLTAELAVVKAKLAKSEEEKAAMRTELGESKAEKAEIRAELNLVRQSTEALNNAMLQAQQHIALMTLCDTRQFSGQLSLRLNYFYAK